ncbi:MAG: hypothetical protein CFE43_03835 [Burkholderiales bacterium PBB3]|nr:MAG: hypothetical protein CFE43_03835 [Burkholderiales bacterium PBB3]
MTFNRKSSRFSYVSLACLLVVVGFAGTFAFRYYRYQTSAYIQNPEVTVDEAIAVMQAHALGARNVADWGLLREESLVIANKKGNEIDLDNALGYLTEHLEDGHSFYLSRSQYEAVETRTASWWWNTSITSPLIEVATVPLVRVNGFISMDTVESKMASQLLRAQVDIALAMDRCGVIVDLSENGGGNMYPMLMGLLPLLSEGTLIQFESASGQMNSVVSEGGAIKYGNAVIMAPLVTPYARASQKSRVALVLSTGTGSSGEMVAIAFKGQKNVRFFGEPTAGATTGNVPYRLSHGGFLALATSRTWDRVGEKYVGPVQPDEVVKGMRSSVKARQLASQWVTAECKQAETAKSL